MLVYQRVSHSKSNLDQKKAEASGKLIGHAEANRMIWFHVGSRRLNTCQEVHWKPKQYHPRNIGCPKMGCTSNFNRENEPWNGVLIFQTKPYPHSTSQGPFFTGRTVVETEAMRRGNGQRSAIEATSVETISICGFVWK